MSATSDSAAPDAIRGFSGGYSFLSNFFRSPFIWKSRVWPGAEWAYQAWKTTDVEWQERIRTASSPAEAKRLGRAAPARPNMEARRLLAMANVLAAKFAVGTGMARRLLATGDAFIMEGNRHGDTYWGCVRRGNTWVGSNHLGKLLMARRQQLREVSVESR